MTCRPRRGVLALLLLLVPLLAGAAEPLRVQGDRQLLGPQAMAHVDSTRSLGVEAVHAAPATAFQALPDTGAYGFQSGAVWVRLQLDWTGATGERWLEVPTALLDHADLYRRNPEGHWTVLTNGRTVPYSRRSVPVRFPTFLLDPGTGVETLYLRVASVGTIEIEPILWDPPAYAERLVQDQFWFGLGVGLLTLLALIHFTIGVALRDRVSLLYSSYALLTATFMLSFGGVISGLVAPEHPRLDYWILSVCFPGFLLLVWPVFSAIVDLHDSAPRLDWFMTLAGVIAGLVGAAARLAGYNHLFGPPLSLIFLVQVAALAVVACWLVLRGNTAARFYLFTFLPMLLLGGYIVARNMGGPRIEWLNGHVGDLAIYLHVTAMNLPVVARLLRIREERDEALALTLRNTQEEKRRLDSLVAERTAALAVAKDQAEAALVTAQELMEGQRRLIQTVSHEFRTPLAIIDGTAQLLELQDGPSLPGNPSPAATIRAKVQKLLGFLDGALRQDKLGSGQWRLTPEAVAPEELLDTVLAGVDADPGRHPVELRLDHLPAMCRLDPNMISILVGNLVENAIHYSPEGGAIVVTALGLPGGGLRVSVADHGIGIPPAVLPRIFDRFYRTGQLPEVNGSGLGLYLAREIAHLHGGELTVESQLGRGTTFTLTLPPGASV